MISGSMTPLAITEYTLTTCLGAGRAANWDKIERGETGLKPCDFFDISDLSTWIGEVTGVDQQALPASLAAYNCRNNRLAWLALQQDGFLDNAVRAIESYGADRVGVFIGTSTSEIGRAHACTQVTRTARMPPSA